jgi:DNA-binding SARP family transcriptional activator
MSVPGLVITPTLDAALDHTEALLLRRARHTGLPEPDDSTGQDGAAPALPATVLIATPPRASQRLRGVLESGRHLAVAGIVLGEWPPGSTCHVTPDGTVTSADPALDGIQMFHLDTTDSTAVLHLIQAACGNPASEENRPAPAPGGPPPPQGSRLPAREPHPPAASHTLPPRAADTADRRDIPSGGVAPGAPVTSPPDVPRTAPPLRKVPRLDTGGHAIPGGPAVRVEVLGALRITTADREIEGGLRKARELLAFLAVHPGGASGEAISEALWPEAPPGHSARQRSLALRKLRDLLRAATGLPGLMFVVLAAERYRLDRALIATDVADFQAALDAARHAPDEQGRLAALKDAAALYRGPLADGAGYEWAEPYAETARRRALDTWTAIAELLEPAEPDQALAALDTALGHDPYNEYLYQRIMRLQAAAGRPEAVRRTLALLETRLAELGVTPGAQTRQAAATLLGPPGPPPVPQPLSAMPNVPGAARPARPPAPR